MQKANIAGIRQETPSVKVLTLDLRLDFVPGQFVMLGIPGYVDSRGSRRAYSIASAPGDQLELVIKINPAPSFSSAVDKLSVGDSVEVDGPFGKFLLRRPVSQDTTFIAGGTGIAPIMSMLRTASRAPIPPKVVLFFGIKTLKDCIFRSELDGLQAKGIQVIYCLSQEEREGFVHGRITSVLPKFVPKSDVYICGSPEMVKDTAALLESLGVQKEKIVREQW